MWKCHSGVSPAMKAASGPSRRIMGSRYRWCHSAGMRWTAAAVAEAVGGTLTGPDVAIASVTQDSRDVADLDAPLFVALVAERDGHEFVAPAVGAGAVACLVSEAEVVVPAYAFTAVASAVVHAGSDRLSSTWSWTRST